MISFFIKVENAITHLLLSIKSERNCILHPDIMGFVSGKDKENISPPGFQGFKNHEGSMSS
ncbi:hypothetical protein [Chryseobacterium nepalense]|jgi:hypothetical protein|uniref:hypothetical protein n=1 Tax=Chryseobacterium nepalense TaxID=1854498 RepID=UPI002E070F8E|nr:hypothetical protein [Chryseobacterium nepalense]